MLASPDGWTAWAARWKVVRLWDIPAADLLEQRDVGLIPWVPLTRFDGAPEALFALCRERIDADAPPGEHENLLVVTQILAGLRYNDPRLFSILGGKARHDRITCPQRVPQRANLRGKASGHRPLLKRAISAKRLRA